MDNDLNRNLQRANPYGFGAGATGSLLAAQRGAAQYLLAAGAVADPDHRRRVGGHRLQRWPA